MGSKIFRIVFALCFALSAVGFSTSTVLADPPVRFVYPIEWEPIPSEGVCDFPIIVTSTFQVMDTYFQNQDGAFMREYVHAVEVDVFAANGKSLTSDPYAYNIQWILDGNWNVVGEYVSGIVVKVRLPEGKMFFAAGRTDLSANPGSGTLIPDKGRAGNIEAFCAALAP